MALDAPPAPARVHAKNAPLDREIEERFIRYVRVDTQSDESSPTSPSTERQFDLLHMLEAELNALGAQDVRVTDYGVVLATIPATVKTSAPTIAFLAHVDTAPAFNATGVRPIVHRQYAGGAIVLTGGDGRRERAPRPIPADRSAAGLQLPRRLADHELPALGRVLGAGRVRGLRVLERGDRFAPVVETEMSP